MQWHACAPLPTHLAGTLPACLACLACRTTAKLEQAQGILSETEDIGINVIDTMQQQRESILRSTAKAESTNALTDVARGILRGMQRSAITNKFLLAGIILVLLLAIGVVVYFGYIK